VIHAATKECSLSENGGTQDGALVWTLNRGLVVLRPNDPLVQWVATVDRTGRPMDVDAIRTTSTAFLIPEYETPDESWEWIRDNCVVFFELELIDWTEDETLWPQDRGWDVFQEWFTIEFIDTTWDLVDEPLSSDVPDD
jgi:hypothetical protein